MARCLYINKVKSCLWAFDGGWGRVMPYPVPYAFRPQPLAAFTVGVGLCVGILASQLPRVFFFILAPRWQAASSWPQAAHHEGQPLFWFLIHRRVLPVLPFCVNGNRSSVFFCARLLPTSVTLCENCPYLLEKLRFVCSYCCYIAALTFPRETQTYIHPR